MFSLYIIFSLSDLSNYSLVTEDEYRARFSLDFSKEHLFYLLSFENYTDKSDPQTLYLEYKSLIGLDDNATQYQELNGSYYIIGNGIINNHPEFRTQNISMDIKTYREIDPETLTYDDNDIYFPSDSYDNNISAKYEGTASTSIAFGGKIGLANLSNVHYYPFSFHLMFLVQAFTEI